MDCVLPGSSVHGILQARILEWIAMPSFSRGSSRPRDQTQGSLMSPALAGGFFMTSATLGSPVVWVTLCQIPVLSGWCWVLAQPKAQQGRERCQAKRQRCQCSMWPAELNTGHRSDRSHFPKMIIIILPVCLVKPNQEVGSVNTSLILNLKQSLTHVCLILYIK